MSAQPQSNPDEVATLPTALSRGIGEALLKFFDETRRATSLVDVNIAAGMMMVDLADLLGHSPEQTAQLIQLPFNAG